MNIDTETQSMSLEDVILDFYADVKQEITNKHQDLEELKKMNIFQVVDYLRQSIDLLVSLRLEKLEKEMKLKSDSTYVPKDENYESLIRKLEKEIRQHIRVIVFILFR
jgi:hypothetical protein